MARNRQSAFSKDDEQQGPTPRFRDGEELRIAAPNMLRYRVWHLPTRVVHYARK